MMIAGLLILEIMNNKTVYVIRYIYRSTAIGMKYFLNRQTRRKAMDNENNTMPNTTIFIPHCYFSTAFLIV